jgi:cytoskeletal protein CcmA (bactofilin family)
MKIVVNGTTVEVPDGSNVSVIGDQVIVNNGEGIKFSGNLKIEVIGGLINLKTERGDVSVQGDIAGDITAAGDVSVGGKVGGNVDSSGDVICADVGGNVDASGDVKCGDVGGDIDASGDVRYQGR